MDMEGLSIALVASLVGSAGVAGAIAAIAPFSYGRRLEASIKRLKEARSAVTRESEAARALDQAIRFDATLLAMSRLHGPRPMQVFIRVSAVVGTFVICAIVAIGMLVSGLAGDDASEIASTWVIFILMTMQFLLIFALVHIADRDLQRVRTATIIAFDGNAIETPEIRKARKRIARTRRRMKFMRQRRQRRWQGDKADTHWARMRHRAQRRKWAAEHPWALGRDDWAPVDDFRAWPYREG